MVRYSKSMLLLSPIAPLLRLMMTAPEPMLTVLFGKPDPPTPGYRSGMTDPGPMPSSENA